ncbi:hypothetical protein HMI54_014139 [Coelomomyces lativittatus]|nr:hypothetical protein HMI54_014139 [Coelomomyces lativittatus]
MISDLTNLTSKEVFLCHLNELEREEQCILNELTLLEKKLPDVLPHVEVLRHSSRLQEVLTKSLTIQTFINETSNKTDSLKSQLEQFHSELVKLFKCSLEPHFMC